MAEPPPAPKRWVGYYFVLGGIGAAINVIAQSTGAITAGTLIGTVVCLFFVPLGVASALST
jgi:hypothetical protein